MRLGGIFEKNKMALILLGLMAALSIVSPKFLSQENIANVLWSMSVLGVLTAGTIYVPISGGVDLSVGSMVSLSGVLVYILTNERGLPVVAAVLITLAVCSAIGFLHGLVITGFEVPAFILTMAAKSYLQGISMYISDGRTIPFVKPDSFVAIGVIKILGFPLPIYIMLFIIGVSHCVLHYHSYGMKALAVGGNAVASDLCGLNANRVRVLAFTASAFTAGVGGIMLASITRQAYYTAGLGMELDVVTAIIVGGNSLAGGGYGTVLGSLAGVIVMGFILNGMNLMNVEAQYHPIVTGVIIIAALAVNNGKIHFRWLPRLARRLFSGGGASGGTAS